MSASSAITWTNEIQNNENVPLKIQIQSIHKNEKRLHEKWQFIDTHPEDRSASLSELSDGCAVGLLYEHTWEVLTDDPHLSCGLVTFLWYVVVTGTDVQL